jgi:putative membrane-bound dehydrogenase-like protein
MNRPRLFLTLLAISPALAFGQATEGGDGAKKKDRDPEGVSLQDNAESALKKFSVAPGLRVDLWAAEPLLANPVAFSFDEKGRAFVVETYRRRTSVPDIRKNMAWLLDSLGMRKVEDRVAFLRKALAPELKLKPTKNHEDLNGDGQFDWRDWATESERVKLVEDSDGDGLADTASVFADGFNSAETGTAAGVLARGNDVWFACIPDVWHFSGASGKTAASKENLLTGFGVHIAYGGHDMHGVKIGPDGRLYWSIADCGASVKTKEGKLLDNPDSGAVFRCELDGSRAEIVAIGLRNPQSLAWNDVGDLFTGDNNADGGDKARWTHVVEGGDYGWRIGWQFLPKLGPWNSEGMWHLENATTNLALLPPVGLIGHGPAGIAHYPGTGLPEIYADHFFYADFPGGVRAFALRPKGASYTAENPGDVLQDNQAKNMTGKFLWGLYPSDVGFGVDGGAYVLDWVMGWEKTGKGRIFRVHDAAVDASPVVQETKKLLAEGMDKRDDAELVSLLGHRDQRVRLAAQFALAEGNKPGPLLDAALKGTGPAQIHGIWGIGQWERLAEQRHWEKAGAFAKDLAPLLASPAAEVRAQAAKVCGAVRVKSSAAVIIRLLTDKEPRVRFFAAQALGKLGVKEAVPALIALLKLNNDGDAYVRHACALALASLADEKALKAAADDNSAAVRAGVLLALRRQRSAEVARFLSDKSQQLALEAARAIHDGAIPAAWPQLAMLADKPGLAEPVRRRVVNASYLLGTAEAAQRLARIGSDPNSEADLRIDALQALGVWNEPFRRDRVIGLWRDLPATRDAQAALDAAGRILPALLREPSEPLRLAAVEMAGTLKLIAGESVLLGAVGDKSLGGTTRAAALRALAAMESPKLADAVKLAAGEKDKALLEAARQLAAKISPLDAVKLNAPLLEKGTTRDKQEALATIAAQPVLEADQIILAQLDRLAANQLPPALWLDLLEAAAQRDNPEIKRRLAEREAALARSNDPIARWRDCLEGGNAKLGREIFTEKAEAACMRCHKYKGEGGDVGPDLAKIAQVTDRIYLLESIIDPNAKIAPGYDNVLLTLHNGEMVAGILNLDGAEEVTLTGIADGKKQKIKTADIKERTHVPSAMPPGLADVLGKRGLRDVIEFLASGK